MRTTLVLAIAIACATLVAPLAAADTTSPTSSTTDVVMDSGGCVNVDLDGSPPGVEWDEHC